MRLDDDIQFLKGFGPKRADSFNQSGIKTLRDLLNIVPYKYLSHESAIPINQLKVDDYVTVIGTVMTCGLQRGRRRRFVAMISDGNGICQAVWFNYVHQIQNKINKNDRVALTGKVGYYNGFQIVHPSIEIMAADQTVEQASSVIPVYSIPEKLKAMSVSSDFVRKTIKQILTDLEYDPADDQLPHSIRERYGFSDLNLPIVQFIYRKVKKRV